MEDLDLIDLRPEPELADPEAIVLPNGATSLDLLRAIYRDHRQALTVRLKAAGIAAQYEHAKLGVSVVVTDGSIAERLARAVERANRVRGVTSSAQLITQRSQPIEVRKAMGPAPTPADAPMPRMRRPC